MRPDLSLSFRQIVRGGVDLARQTLLIGIATAAILVIEPHLPSLPTIAASLDQSLLDDLLAAVSKIVGAAVAALTIVSLAKSFLACWFTAKAMAIRNGFASGNVTIEFCRYFFVFLLAETFIYLVFSAIGLSIISFASIFIFPTSRVLERAVVGVSAIALFPLFVTLISFTLYWSYFERRMTPLFKRVAWAISKFGVIGYIFFAGRSVVDVGGGFVVPILVLRSGLPYGIRVAIVVVVMTAIITWLRGVGFDFKNSLFRETMMKGLHEIGREGV